MTYKSYCADMKKFKQVPMSETDFNIMQGIGEETQKPLIIEPKKDMHKMAASLDNFIKVAESSKRRRAIRISESLPKKIKAEKQPPKTNRVTAPKVSLKGMADEEKKEHKRKLNREWKKKKYGEKEKVIPLTHEERKARARERYHAKKPIVTRIFYKDLTPEELAAHLKEQRRLHTIKTKEKRKAYREANKEKYKEYGKEWAQKNQEKRRESNRKYIEANKEKVTARRREWNEKNKEKRREINNRADAKRRANTLTKSATSSEEEMSA